MTQQDWDQLCKETTNAMCEHIKPFVTPLSSEIEKDVGKLEGSGSYLDWNDVRWAITNEHVARIANTRPLNHQLFGSDLVFRIRQEFRVDVFPLDIGAAITDSGAWQATTHVAQAIPESRLANKHNPVEGEMLFLVGFPGQRSTFLFESLISPGTPYLTQEHPLPAEFDPNFHFALHWNPELARSVDGSTRGLPLPPGLSGSLVWNTRRVELAQGKEWSPTDAVVTGIVWGWNSDSCLLATRVEHIRSFLNRRTLVPDVDVAGPRTKTWMAAP
ncbi:MAG: hypothetical protein ACLGIW_00455 [Gammaproteobacteria bacterium]